MPNGGERTTAWILHPGPADAPDQPAHMEQGEMVLPELGDEHCLVESLYGCWEGNMSHAIERKPVDVCTLRGEDQVVLGNAGVVRILRVG